MMRYRMQSVLVPALLLLLMVSDRPALGFDTELNRSTLAGLPGVNVVVEDLQPNVLKYAVKFNLTKEQLEKEIGQKLQKAGIKTLSREDWFKTKGKPLLYININTHEYEKYWYAFDVRVELKQLVSLESNPALKLLATTWFINITGIANIGTLGAIRDNLGILLDRFVNAYTSVNPRKNM